MLARGKTEQLSEMANRLLPQTIEMGHASMMTGRALSAMLDNEIINLVLATHCTVPASVERHVCTAYVYVYLQCVCDLATHVRYLQCVCVYMLYCICG